MAEFVKLIQRAKTDDDKMMEILNKLSPLRNKYVKKLFFLEKEDAEQEINMAIIEAIKGIKKSETDGQCLLYIKNAVKFKYVYLCKKNIYHCQEECYEGIENDSLYMYIEMYEDIELMFDIEKEKEKLSSKQKKIFEYIIEGYSDMEISKRMGISRQYINRVKKDFYKR